MDLFSHNSDITSVSELIKILKNDEMDYTTLDEDITEEGLSQIHIYLKSGLVKSKFSNVILETLDDLKQTIEEYNNDDTKIKETVLYLYQNLILTIFIENLKYI